MGEISVEIAEAVGHQAEGENPEEDEFQTLQVHPGAERLVLVGHIKCSLDVLIDAKPLAE